MSICIVLSESDISNLNRLVDPFLNRGITFTFYIAKEFPDNQYHSYYVLDDKRGKFRNYNRVIYPMNIARDLAIESVTTTHYLFIDIDFFISDTLYDNLLSSSSLLSKQKSVFLLPIFQVKQEIIIGCRKNNTCESLYFCIVNTI